MKGKLYLIPTPLGESKPQNYLDNSALEIIANIKHFIVEEERTARRFLSSLKLGIVISDLSLHLLNEHTSPTETNNYLDTIELGNIGLMSEAGVPCIADPGNLIVQMAHKKGIEVIPFIGPSSIILALMASGLNGQNFAFNGYLPIQNREKMQKIKFLEKRSISESQTQIFIEAPYRNNQLLKDLVETCMPQTRICVAVNLTLPDAFIRTMTAQEWKKNLPDIHKKPAIFLLLG